MDMTMASMMTMNLQSLQSAMSMVTMDKAMNQDAALMGEMLTDFTEANPATSAPVPAGAPGSVLNTYA